MAEYFGKGISVGSGFDLGANLPLDNRTIQASIAERDTMPTIQLVEGLLVYVKENKTLYILKGFNPDGTNRKWEPIATGGVIEIINNLESDRTDAALSAAQGKKINTLITELKNSLSAALEYKGTVDNYELLPKENNKKGDVWNVTAAHGNIPAGTNYAWDGTKWDALGGQVDLSGYATKTSVTSDINAAKTEIKQTTDALSQKVTTVENNLKNKIDSREGFGLISDANNNQITTNKNAIATLTTSLGKKQDALTSGNAIDISAAKVIDVKLDPATNSALSKGADGLKLDLSGVKGTTIKNGEAILSGWIGADQTITQSLQTIASTIQTINTNKIDSISSTDNTIIVTGTVAKDIKVNINKLCSTDSAIKPGTDGKLDIFWTEIE